MPLLSRVEPGIDADEDDIETFAQEVGKGLRRIDAAFVGSHTIVRKFLPNPTMAPVRRLVIAASRAVRSAAAPVATRNDGPGAPRLFPPRIEDGSDPRGLGGTPPDGFPLAKSEQNSTTPRPRQSQGHRGFP